MSNSPDGFTVFPSSRSLESYERSVTSHDNARFDAFLESHKDDPEVAAWLAQEEDAA